MKNTEERKYIEGMYKNDTGKREESQEYETSVDNRKFEQQIRKKVETNCRGKDYVILMGDHKVRKGAD